MLRAVLRPASTSAKEEAGEARWRLPSRASAVRGLTAHVEEKLAHERNTEEHRGDEADELPAELREATVKWAAIPLVGQHAEPKPVNAVRRARKDELFPGGQLHLLVTDELHAEVVEW